MSESPVTGNTTSPDQFTIQEYAVPAGTHPHDVAPDPNGSIVRVSDFGSNSIVRFDPSLELFTVSELPSPNSAVRQILGRPGEVWGAALGMDKLVVMQTGVP